MTVDTYNLKGEKVGAIELPPEIFEVKWNPLLVKQALVAQLADKRRPWAHAKGRGEVRGGGRKPWRQKGTGRARHGSIRSPLWAGGGKAHGPQKQRNYWQKLNKKMRRSAVLSALSKKFKDSEIKFFESFQIEAPKTKMLAAPLQSLLNLKRGKKFDLVLVPSQENKSLLLRAGRNLQKVKILGSESLNLQDLLGHKNIFIEKDAISAITQRYHLGKILPPKPLTRSAAILAKRGRRSAGKINNL